MHVRLHHLLVPLCSLFVLLPALPGASAAAATPFTVTTTLDGHSTLPTRIRWIAHPKPAVRATEGSTCTAWAPAIAASCGKKHASRGGKLRMPEPWHVVQASAPPG